MSISLKGHHIEVTDALSDYTTSKLNRLYSHFDGITNIHVTFSVENKHLQRAEATVHVPGEDLHAHADAEEMYASVDLLVDKLDRMVKRYKEKLRDHRE